MGEMKEFIIRERKRLALSSIILVLLLIVIFLSSNLPINIAIGMDVEEMYATAEVVVEENGDRVSFHYSVRHHGELSYFLLVPYDFIRLEIQEIILTTDQPIPGSEIQVGYIMIRPIFRYNVQERLILSEREGLSPYYTYVITREQADRILQVTSSQNTSTFTLSAFLLIVFVLYVISLTRMLITKKILLSILLVLTLFSVAIAIWRSITFVWLFLVLLMVVGGIFYEDLKVKKKVVICVIYGAALLLTFSRLQYLSEHFYYVYDEPAHIGYIDYLVQNPTVLVPRFEEMNINAYQGATPEMVFTPENREGIGENYLGHPPLYYQMMRLVGGTDLGNGITLLNYTRMLLVSMMFFLVGTGIYMYIALSRFKDEVSTHLLVATGLCAYTFYVYSFSGLNNDALGFLAVAIFFLGAFRFAEGKYNLLTFFLVTTSISMAVLTKLNIGLSVFVIGIALLFTEVVLRKNYQLLKNWRLYVSFIAFIPPLVYNIKHYIEYHSFVASFPLYNPIGFREHIFFGDANAITPMEPVHIVSRMFRIITSRLLNEEVDRFIPRPITGTAMIPTNFLPNLPFILIFGGAALALFLMALKVFKPYKYRMIFIATAISVLVSIYFLVDIAYSNVFTTARLGGVQARYFHHTLPIAILSLAYLLEIMQSKFKDWIQSDYAEKFETMFKHMVVVTCVLLLFEKMVLSFIA